MKPPLFGSRDRHYFTFKYELIARRTTSPRETFSRLAAAFSAFICFASIRAINRVSFITSAYHMDMYRCQALSPNTLTCTGVRVKLRISNEMLLMQSKTDCEHLAGGNGRWSEGSARSRSNLSCADRRSYTSLVKRGEHMDCVVRKLRELKQPVTKEAYAELAYWKPYRTLSAEEKQQVREMVRQANLQ
jgi:hypothetical protein